MAEVPPRQSGWSSLGSVLAALLTLAAPPGAPARAATAKGAPAPVVIRVDPQTARPGPTAVRSLDAALERVASLRLTAPDRPITIDLAAGTYRLVHPLRIGPEHSGVDTAALTLRGASGRRSRIGGSVALQPVSTVLDPAAEVRLPDFARPHVRFYRLPAAALASPRIHRTMLLHSRPDAVGLEVYDAAGEMRPARWPNEGWARVASGTTDAGQAGFTVDTDRLKRWQAEPDLWAEGYWRWNWLYESLPVSGVDAASKRIALPQLPYEGILTGARFRIAHALSELDQPGEWWRDSAGGLLLAWPRPGTDTVEVAVTDTLLAIDGASHVRIENLDIENSRGDLVSVEGGSDVVIRDSHLSHAGARGVVFAGSRDSGVEDCDIEDIGRVAVRLDGGDRMTLTAGGLFLRHSRITRFALRSRTQTPAVELDGVGALVEGNDIHDGIDAALHIHGNDHRILGNEIARLMTGTTDDGAIYAGRDWTAQGTRIEGNFLHDIRADPGFELKGIYLDDFASGFTVRRNLFLRVDQPVFIGGGRDNRVEHNVFIASSPGVHVDSRGLTWATSSISDPQSELRAAYAAMPAESTPWRRRYPGLAGIMQDRPGVARANRIERNLFVLGQDLQINDGGEASEQVIRDNRGPLGVGLGADRDLATSARTSSDPRDFGSLFEAGARDAAGFDLSAMARSLNRPGSGVRGR